jgi:hypothetical protein
MPAIYVLISIPLFFYLIIPAMGAFRVRIVWRQFREQMINASFFPICGYEDILSLKKEGFYRFFGEIEAVQSDRLLWVRNDEITVSVKMENCHIYMIPSEKKRDTQMPIKLPWNRVFSIAEGTAIYICGDVVVEQERSIFSGTKKSTLVVIIYDGEKESLLERSISCGRQKNEYWNFLTPWSIAVGGILSLLLLDMMIKANVSSSVLLLGVIISAFPIIPFLPPGLFFFYLYINMWKKGRICRSDRDLVGLALRFENRNIGDPDYLHMQYSSGRPLFPMAPGYTIRNIHFNEKHENKVTLWHNSAFGTVVFREDGKWLEKPEDPMKEYLLLKNDPIELIHRSNRKALVYELLSLLFISLSVIINTWMSILLIRYLM